MEDTREIRHMAPRTDAGGEGSRGGKIVGHTGSGKPIYMNNKHPTHKEFSASDHGSAQKLHHKLSQEKTEKAVGLIGKGKPEQLDKHLASAKEHNAAAEHHSKETFIKSSKDPDKVRASLPSNKKKK